MTETETTLAVREDASAPLALFGTSNPVEVIAAASKIATALADVVNKRELYAVVNKRKFPTVEAWTLLGSMLGVFPITEWSRPILNEDGSVRGYEARVRAQTLSGRVVGAGEAMCVRGESKTWDSAAKEFALRSMAQTRATSKALRGPLDFVFKLAGFQPTPAEEMADQTTGEIPLANASAASRAAMHAAQEGAQGSDQRHNGEGSDSPPSSAAIQEAGAAAVTPEPPLAPARGPRAKRQNVVAAPVAPEVKDAPARTPEPAAIPDLVDEEPEDGQVEYLATLRESAREMAAVLAHLRVKLTNHKQRAEIALGTAQAVELPPLTPNPGSDGALQRFIAQRWPQKMLADLGEAELDGSDAAPGVLRVLQPIIDRLHEQGISEGE